MTRGTHTSLSSRRLVSAITGIVLIVLVGITLNFYHAATMPTTPSSSTSIPTAASSVPLSDVMTCALTATITTSTGGTGPTGGTESIQSVSTSSFTSVTPSAGPVGSVIPVSGYLVGTQTSPTTQVYPATGACTFVV